MKDSCLPFQARRQEIIRRSMERDSKFQERSKRSQSGLGFGSRTPRMVCETIDATKRAASQGNLLRPSHPQLTEESPDDSDSGSVHRRAVSACSLSRKGAPATTADKSGMRMSWLLVTLFKLNPILVFLIYCRHRVYSVSRIVLFCGNCGLNVHILSYKNISRGFRKGNNP